jgi:lipoprotein-releasing system permease protein
MNRIEFYLKYIFRSQDGGYNNWRFYFPALGLAVGIMSIVITFAIMQGMEDEVFKKLEAINLSSKILDNHFIKPNNDKNFIFTIDKKAIISNGDNYRIVNVRAIENFQEYKNARLYEFIEQIEPDLSGVILGISLAGKLNVDVGDIIELYSPSDINFITGSPNSLKVKISGIFNFKLLDYDDRYIFTDISIGENLFETANKEIYSYLNTDELNQRYENIRNIKTWEDEHIDFIAAMNLEKLAFSSFGFLIIVISAFSSFSIICVSIIRRISEIGILRTLGYSKEMISQIYFFQSLLIGLFGGFIGVFLSKLFIMLDGSYSLTSQIFSSELLFDFKLNISNYEIFIIYIIGLSIMLFSGIYPSMYASRMPILKSLNYNK